MLFSHCDNDNLLLRGGVPGWTSLRQSIEWARRDAVWLPKLSHKSHHVFCQALALSLPHPFSGDCILLEPSFHMVRKPRPQAEAMCKCSGQWPASTSKHVSERRFRWFQSLSLPDETPDIVEEKQAILCPVSIPDAQIPWQTINNSCCCKLLDLGVIYYTAIDSHWDTIVNKRYLFFPRRRQRYWTNSPCCDECLKNH